MAEAEAFLRQPLDALQPQVGLGLAALAGLAGLGGSGVSRSKKPEKERERERANLFF